MNLTFLSSPLYKMPQIQYNEHREGAYPMEENLLFLESPLCPIAAEVIQNEESVYFYLYDLNFEEERLEVRSACWIKNLVEAPDQFDLDLMEEGRPPLMPKEYIKETMDFEPYHEEDLEIVWSKEGHIAGLYHKGEVICVIPSWATPSQMSGYSKYCNSDSIVAWELTDENALIPRLEEGREFWNQDFTRTWREYSESLINDLHEQYGASKQCFEINKDSFPSRYLITQEEETTQYAFTVGMGMFAMPNTDQYIDDYESRAYCELAFAWEKDSLSEEELHTIFSQMAGLSNLPWNAIDYMGHGHTIDFLIEGYPYAILLRNETIKGQPEYEIEKQGICMNWIVPITKEEFQAMQEAKTNTALIEQIKEEHRLIFQRKGMLS